MTLKVLVVDDEALARSRMRTLLGDCTAPNVSLDGEAANATQAIELLRRHSFDVALLDIHMPGADGLTLAQTLRTLPNAPAVVFITAMPNTPCRPLSWRPRTTSPNPCGWSGCR